MAAPYINQVLRQVLINTVVQVPQVQKALGGLVLRAVQKNKEVKEGRDE